MIKQSAQSTNKLQEIWAEKTKSKTLPMVSFADGIGKAKDLNCKIFSKHWKILKILFLFHLSKTFNNFFIFPWVSNFNQFSMTFPWLSRKIYFSRIFNDFPWPCEPWLSERDCVFEGWAVLTRQRNNETVELLRNNSIARHSIRDWAKAGT